MKAFKIKSGPFKDQTFILEKTEYNRKGEFLILGRIIDRNRLFEIPLSDLVKKDGTPVTEEDL